MKTIFATIGFIVVALWAYHFMGNKSVKPAIKTAWDISSPYINNAVNGMQDKAKRASNH
jgi:hypothetical protein